jgi:ATP-binding cassette subfamily B protein
MMNLIGSASSGPSVGQTGLDEDQFGSVFDHRVVGRMVPYILPHKRLLAAAIVSMLAFTGSQVAVPWLIGKGIDDYIGAGDFEGLTWIVALFFGNAMLNWVAGFVQEITIARAGQRVLYRLRGDMFAHLQRLSLNFFDKTEVGRIMSRVQGDVFQLQEFLAVAVVTLGDLLSLVGIVAMLLALSIKLGLISLAVLPILILVVMVWQPFARKSFVKVRRSISIVNGALNENITGVRVVQSMNRQDRNLELFDDKNRDNFSANLFATRFSAGLLPPVDILTALSIGLAIYFGSQLVSAGALEVGAMVAFVMYIQRFFDPVRSLTMQYTQLQRAMASGARVFELLDRQPDLVDAPGAKELPSLRGEIEFRDVSYSYSRDQDVLKNVSLHAKPGETVAIVGPTGAGKTTLVSLLSRFYEVPRDRGAILVDGHDIRDVTRRSLSRQMSMVLQEPFLFSGTVRENIRYCHTEVTEEGMVEATKAVGAHDFITRLEDGYDTYLHERGVNLSVGQRQLLSFARAIVADPRILILDEATANIDSYTEMLIQRALRKLLQGRTAIVIAHRLSTIRGADKIVVLDHGEIVEEGTHKRLVAANGLYAHLYQMNYAALEAAVPTSNNEVGKGF